MLSRKLPFCHPELTSIRSATEYRLERNGVKNVGAGVSFSRIGTNRVISFVRMSLRPFSDFHESILRLRTYFLPYLHKVPIRGEPRDCASVGWADILPDDI